MSFGKIDESALWQKYREEFPVTQRFVYLNQAAVSPLSRRAANAMKHLADDCLLNGSYHYQSWLDVYDELRASAAQLIGAASPKEIALVKNTSEGIATVALGIDWKAGDKIVGFREEFPANYLPWESLQAQGVNIEWLSVTDPLDRIDEACRGARLLAVSFVNYLSGHRVDLNAIGEICQRRDCFFFVDAIQGMGAMTLDVESAHIDALAADGHKWMTGPEGCGILYVRQGRQDQVVPKEIGWTNVAAYNDYHSSRDFRSDAGRYEPGTLNTIGCFGLQAAIGLLLEVGVERISERVKSLADQLCHGVRGKGYELLGTRTPENAAGIVSFRKPGTDSRMIVHHLKEASIQVAARQGWVRTSPHFYVNSTDIERVVAELPE